MPTLTKNAGFLPADLNLLTRETDMFLTTVGSLAPDELAAPSRRAGWTRGDVLAQVARTADAIADLMEQAHAGEAAADAGSAPQAASGDSGHSGDSDDSGAGSDPARLKAAARAACERVRAAAQSLRTGVAAPTVHVEGRDLDAYWLPALWTTHVIVDHHDLDTVWELQEADITALEDAMDLLTSRLAQRASADAPGLRLRTTEGEEHVVGDGAHTLRGDRAALLGWITRGATEGVTAETGDLPAPPAPVLLEPA